MKQRAIHLVSLALAVLMLLGCGISAFAAGDGTQTVTFSVTYQQTEARTMLTMVNQLRTGGNAWYWNADDKTKTVLNDLRALVYDYDLERIAMQRAAEIALTYNSAHKRPDGREFYTAYNTYLSCSENIAVGYPSAQSIFDAWCETNQRYDGQSHRRSMLSAAYTAIGAACVEYDGVRYWVQEFRDAPVSTAPTDANNRQTAVQMDVRLADVTSKTVAVAPASCAIAAGASAALPVASAQICLKNTWQNKPRTVTVAANWSAENPAVAAVSGGQVRGMKAGSTALRAQVLGDAVTVPVTVTGSAPETPDTPQPGTQPAVTIRNVPASHKTTLAYGDQLMLHAELSDCPANAMAVWTVNGQTRGESDSLLVKGNTAEIQVSVTVVQADGTPVTDGSGNPISDYEIVTVNTGFLARLIAFIRQIFGGVRTIDQ